MTKIIIFGNSGSGKSTLAKKLMIQNDLAHMDLDTIAWEPTTPPTRKPISYSKQSINLFLEKHEKWVIEGCYTDLLELIKTKADEIIYLNLPVAACMQNAKNRLWEPHKYKNKAEQDSHLDMLLEWIALYDARTDTFSKAAHEKFFAEFQGQKIMYTSNNHTL